MCTFISFHFPRVSPLLRPLAPQASNVFVPSRLLYSSSPSCLPIFNAIESWSIKESKAPTNHQSWKIYSTPQRAQIRPKWLTDSDSDCEMPIISELACHRVRAEKLHYYAMVVTLRHESEKCVHEKKKAGTFQLLWSALTAASQLPSTPLMWWRKKSSEDEATFAAHSKTHIVLSADTIKEFQ